MTRRVGCRIELLADKKLRAQAREMQLCEAVDVSVDFAA